MKKVICFGEVLWDDFGAVKTIGGAPLNVSYHLSKLNITPIIASQVGSDELGRAIVDQVAEWNIVGSFLNITDRYPTSTVKVYLSEGEKGGGEVSYTIVENVAWDHIEFDQNLLQEIREADAFVFGTLAARSPETRSVLMQYVSAAKWPVLDINLRQPYTHKEVILPLVSACKSIKLNEQELLFIHQLVQSEIAAAQRTAELGKRSAEHLSLDLPLTGDPVQAFIQVKVNEVFKHFENIEEIILTRGADGAAIYTSKGHVALPGIKVLVKDTVGSGDSFLAAFIHGRLSGHSNEDILKEATGLSAFMATQTGGCPPYSLNDIENFKKSIL